MPAHLNWFLFCILRMIYPNSYLNQLIYKMWQFVSLNNHWLMYTKLFLVLVNIGWLGLGYMPLFTTTRNKALLVGGGMFLGAAIFAAILNITSYLIPGERAVLVSTASILFLTIISWRRYRWWTHFSPFKITPKVLFYCFIVLMYLVTMLWSARTAEAGSSAPKYWSIALSFARGNFPTKIPWQPDILAVYHHAPYAIIGALNLLSNLNSYIVHQFFSIYLVWGLFLLLLGWGREINPGYLSILIPITVLILSGGPLLFSLPLEGRPLPAYSDYIVWLGAGATNFWALIYNNYHTFGLGLMFLIVHIWTTERGKKPIKLACSLAFLSAMLISAEEILIGPIIVWLFITVLPDRRNFGTYFLVGGFVFILFFLIIQNALRDSIFTPSPEIVRYKSSDWNQIKSKFVWFESKNINGWILPSGLTLSIVMTTLALGIDSKWVKFSAITAISFFILGILVDQPGFPTNPTRLVNYGYKFTLLTLILFIITILNFKRHSSTLLGITMLVVVLPQLISANKQFVETTFNDSRNYLIYYIDYQDEVLHWIKRNLKFNDRIVFIDEFPKHSSSFTGPALEYYGLFVPLGPHNLKVDLPDVGPEWFDAVTTLSPSALNKLKADYIFVANNEENRFTPTTKSHLINEMFFVLVKKFKAGSLYQILPRYKNLLENSMTMDLILNSIKPNSVVYLDKISTRDVRKLFLFSLQSRNNTIIGPSYRPGHDYYVVAEAPLPKIVELNDNSNVQYIVTDPHQFTDNIFNKNEFKISNANAFVVVWERK